jgi:hypothetical protein
MVHGFAAGLLWMFALAEASVGGGTALPQLWQRGGRTVTVSVNSDFSYNIGGVRNPRTLQI